MSNLNSKQKVTLLIHTTNPIIKHKAGLLNLAEELGNDAKACKIMGVSRDRFYRYQYLLETGGIDNLVDKSHWGPNRKNRVEEAIMPLNNLPMVSTASAMNYANKVSVCLVVW